MICKARVAIAPRGGNLDRFRWQPSNGIGGNLHRNTQRGLEGKPYLLKFGEQDWLSEAIELGRFRIALASTYFSTEHNHARRDHELTRILTPHRNNLVVKNFLKNTVKALPKNRVCANLELTSPFDYYLFSLSKLYSSRLFSDFCASACLLIFNPYPFVERLRESISSNLGSSWQNLGASVKYFDPVRVSPVDVNVHVSKPFRHVYQAEHRIVWWNQETERPLAPFFIKVGSLRDCAELVTIRSQPS